MEIQKKRDIQGAEPDSAALLFHTPPHLTKASQKGFGSSQTIDVQRAVDAAQPFALPHQPYRASVRKGFLAAVNCFILWLRTFGW